MDKLKQRKKRKRLQEKRRQQETEARELTEKLNATFRKHGLKHKQFDPASVMREYNNIQKRSVATAIVYCTICTLYCIRKRYKFGRLRLFRLGTEITVRVNNVATVERSIPQMVDDLEYDAKLNVKSYWKDIKYSDSILPERKNELECFAMHMPNLLNIHMYAVHMALNFKRRRMNRLCAMVVDALQYALAQDKIDYYIDSLKACGFHIDLKGKFGAYGVKQEEFEKFKKRIQWSGGNLLNAKI